MSELQYKKRMTKGAFEDKLVEDFGAGNLSARKHSERDRDTGKSNNMTLYYYNGNHCGTWMTGEGWAFKRSYDSLK